MTLTHTIRCGNCKGSHETTDRVRACYGNSGKLGQAELPKPDLAVAIDRAFSAPISFGPTEKQLAFIARLEAERPSAEIYVPVTKMEASVLIDKLLAMPKEVDLGAGGENSVVALLRNVPDGYYALPSKMGTNDLDFIVVVTRNTKRYVNRYLGGQGPVLISAKEQREFAQQLTKMAALGYLAEARREFGRKLGHCGKCGRALTDSISRAYGIGPTCRSAS
jgi:hypothetical protein